MQNPKVVRINLLNDMFDYADVVCPSAFLIMDDCKVPAVHRTESMLKTGSLFYNFNPHISSENGCDVLDGYLVDKLKSTFIDVHLTDNMPDLSDDKLCFESSTVMRAMSWQVVLKTVIVQALNDLEFCLKLHKTNSDKIIVAFKVETLAYTTLISVYFNDEAANVTSNNKGSTSAKYDWVY